MTATPILDLEVPLPTRRMGVLSRVLGFLVGVVGSLGAMKLFYGSSAPTAGALTFLLALALGVVVHELGHLIAGWAVGFHFNAIQIGWLFVGFEYGKLTISTKRQSTLAGYASVQIDRIRRLRVRLLIFIAGGPGGNLFGALVAAGVIAASESHESPIAAFAAAFAVICLLLAFTNLVPFSIRGFRSDGARILMLLTSKEKTRRWICLMSIARQHKDGKQAKYWSGNWTQTAASIRDGSVDEYAACWASYIRASERKEVEAAAGYLERCLEMSGLLGEFARDLLVLEASIFTAWFRQDPVKAGKWALQIKRPSSFPKLLWLRGLIALDCARGDFASAYAEWEQARKLVEHLPRSKVRESLLNSFDEWGVEIRQRESAKSSGAPLQVAVAHSPE